MKDDCFKRYVEVGRLVLVRGLRWNNKVAVIVQIIDHNRALVEGPTTGVKRVAISFKNLKLTPFVIPNLNPGIKQKGLKKALIESKIIDKWNNSASSKKLLQRKIRTNLSDFDRFKVSELKLQRREALKWKPGQFNSANPPFIKLNKKAYKNYHKVKSLGKKKNTLKETK